MQWKLGVRLTSPRPPSFYSCTASGCCTWGETPMHCEEFSYIYVGGYYPASLLYQRGIWWLAGCRCLLLGLCSFNSADSWRPALLSGGIWLWLCIVLLVIGSGGNRPVQNSRDDRASPWYMPTLIVTCAVDLRLASKLIFHRLLEFYLKAPRVLFIHLQEP